MDEKKLARAQKILETVSEDYVTFEQAKNLFASLQSAVQEVKNTLESKVSVGNQENTAMCDKMMKDIATFEDRINNLLKKSNENNQKSLKKDLVYGLSKIQSLIPTFEEFDDADIQKKITELQNQIDVLLAYESPKLEASEVRDLLETLTEEERLDASAIKNLPEAVVQTQRVIASATALWHLMDVDVSGISVGQSIKWDGVRWIPFTPAGGTGTAVYNEVVAGTATTFTLAHTPTSSGVLRVYANGQRLLPTVDYALAGAIITTVLSWSAGTISCDYEW